MTQLLQQLVDAYRENPEKEGRSLVSMVKNRKDLQEEVIKMTPFLDEYENVDIVERIYYVAKGLTKLQCCSCGKKLTWKGRGLIAGYRETCGDKKCKSSMYGSKHLGQTVISENRDSAFIEWQNSVTEMNDDIVKEHIKHRSRASLITNPVILNYLNNRFTDSDSIEETIQRIHLGVEKKPICARPGCNNPVKWRFKTQPEHYFTLHCCDSCSARDEVTREKCRNTLLENWGSDRCYDSSVYQKKVLEEYGVPYHSQREDVKEKKIKTFIEKYGTASPTSLPEIQEKTKQTVKERYGVDSCFFTDKCKERKAEALKNNQKLHSSRREEEVYSIIKTMYPDALQHYSTYDYEYAVDIYIPSLNLRIEYQGSQYHNTRSFLGLDSDFEELNSIIEKTSFIKEPEKKNKSNMYDEVVYVWSNLDVRKRNEAQKKNMRYLEIYSYTSENDIITQLNRYVESLEKTNIPFWNMYANNPTKRRALIQMASEYYNKKEHKITTGELVELYEHPEVQAFLNTFDSLVQNTNYKSY